MSYFDDREAGDERQIGGMGGVTYYHKKGEEFATKENAQRHASNLKWLYTTHIKTRTQKRPNGTYWVWTT